MCNRRVFFFLIPCWSAHYYVIRRIYQKQFLSDWSYRWATECFNQAGGQTVDLLIDQTNLPWRPAGQSKKGFVRLRRMRRSVESQVRFCARAARPSRLMCPGRPGRTSTNTPTTAHLLCRNKQFRSLLITVWTVLGSEYRLSSRRSVFYKLG